MRWLAVIFVLLNLASAFAQLFLAPNQRNLGPPRPPNALLAVRNLGFLGDGFHPDSKDPVKIAAASKVGKESFGYGYRDTAAHLAKPSTKQVKASKSKLTNAHVRFVVVRAASSKHLHLSQVVILDESGSNVARGKRCTSSSYFGHDASGANNVVDGVLGLKRHPYAFHSAAFGDWWMVDLERVHTVVSVAVYNRGDCCQDRLVGAHMLLLNSDKFVIADRVLDGSPIQIFSFSRSTDKNHLRAGIITADSSLLTPEQQNTTLAPGYFWIEPIFGQWYGHYWLNLIGSNYGTYDSTPIGIIGDTCCMVSLWKSDSSMFCQVSAGTGTGLSVLVYSGEQLGGMTNMFDYLLPSWDRTQPDHGPTTGAFSISIFGLFFGQFDTSPAIRFGDTSCEASKWISDTTIRCKMHQGTGHGLKLDFSLRTQFNITRRLLRDKSEIFIETDEGLELPLSVSFAPGVRGAHLPPTNTTHLTLQTLNRHSVSSMPNQDLDFSPSIAAGTRHDRFDSDLQLQVDARRGRWTGDQSISLNNKSSGV